MASHELKIRLIKSGFGRAVIELNNWRALRGISLRNPERASMVANAILADRLIHKIAPKGGTFVDVGAQYGAVFSMAKRLVPELRVIACEADTEKAKLLSDFYPDCQVFDCAIGETEGEMTFFLNPRASGYNSLVEPRQSDAPTRIVRVAALDDLLGKTTVDVMKIDVEGAELGVLRGAKEIISANQPVIMFESVKLETNSLGYSPHQVWDWFTDLRYGVHAPDSVAHEAPALTKDAFLAAHHYPFRSHNYFAIPSDSREAIRQRARMILGISV